MIATSMRPKNDNSIYGVDRTQTTDNVIDVLEHGHLRIVSVPTDSNSSETGLNLSYGWVSGRPDAELTEQCLATRESDGGGRDPEGLAGLALDGKTLKGSWAEVDTRAGKVRLFSALTRAEGVVVGQRKIPAHTGEQAQMIPLLDQVAVTPPRLSAWSPSSPLAVPDAPLVTRLVTGRYRTRCGV